MKQVLFAFSTYGFIFCNRPSLSADKINLWGEGFREGYTRLGLLKPFLAPGAGTFFFTATATDEDKKV